MATEGDIARLRSQVNEVKRENDRIRREIQEMVGSVNNAYSVVKSTESNAVGALRNGDHTLTSDDDVLHHVDKVQEDIRAKVVLYKNIENAYKNIRHLNNELTYQQGNEKTVKRMITGIIDNESKTLISEQTIVEQAEKLYLSTQHFFLSHIMMDLQLRPQGKIEAANRARAKAEEMEPRKTAWVYFIVALKRGDEAEENFWLDKLMNNPMTGNEKEQLKIMTLIALKEQGKIVDKVRSYIGIDKVRDIDKDQVVASILNSYRESMIHKPPSFQYIDKYITEREKLYEALEGAMNNEEVGIYIQNISARQEGKIRGDVIDKMFESVIESCNSPRADEIYAEIEYNQKIIEAKGVIEDALALKAQDDVMNVSDIKLEDCLFEWLVEKERYSGKKEMNEYAYSKLRPSYKRAYKQYVSDYRKKFSQKVTMDLGSYKTQTTLTNVKEEEVRILDFCEKRKEREKAAIKDIGFILCMIFGGILLVAGIVLNFLSSVIGSPWDTVGLILGVVAGSVLLVIGVSIKYKNYQKRNECDRRCESDKATLVERLRYVYSDMEAFREIYRSYDNKTLEDTFF